MKKLLSCLFLVSMLHFHCGAQKNHFTDAGNSWTFFCGHYSGGSSLQNWTDSASVLGYDTIANMIYSNINGVLYRDDTLANAVFMYDTRKGAEKIVYDYNLKFGDTLKIDSLSAVVSGLDSVLINGTFYKKWTFSVLSHFSWPSYVVIEGVGCSFGPDYPLKLDRGPDYGCDLCAFMNRGRLITIAGYSGSGCSLSITTQVASKQNICVLPNPAMEYSSIVFSNVINSGNISLVNSFGKVVFHSDLQHTKELKLNMLTVPGLYMYVIHNIDLKETYTGKFIYL